MRASIRDARLIYELERELDKTGRVSLIVDYAELRRAQSETGIAESHTVEHVEKLAAELQVDAAFMIEAVILHESHI